MGKRPDFCTGFHRDARSEHHVGFNLCIAADHRVKGEIHRVGCHQRHAVLHHPGAGAGLKNGLCGGQIRTGINPQRFRLVACDGRYRQGAAVGQFGHIGQVILVGRIVVSDLGYQVKQGRRIAGQQPAVAKRNCPFPGAGVLVFHDPEQPVAIHYQPPVPRIGVGRIKAQNDHVMGFARRDHPVQRFGAHKRCVAKQHDDIAIKPGQRVARLIDGMRGAELFALNHGFGVRVDVAGRGLNLSGAVPGHDNGPFGRKRGTGLHGMRQHRGTGDGVQHLGHVRLHSCAFARGQNDKRDFHSGFLFVIQFCSFYPLFVVLQAAGRSN